MPAILLSVKPLLFTGHEAPGQKADSTLRYSQAVPDPSTNRALSRLTSEVERDPVHSTRYGRQREADMPWQIRSPKGRPSPAQPATFQLLPPCGCSPLHSRHCVRVAKEMDSKSIGLCPQGFESPRCRMCKCSHNHDISQAK